jgi:OmpA-OmpF porin, OOP family
MLMNLRRLLIPTLAAALAPALTTSGASAQTTARGFALDRFEPSERGSDWFVADSLDLRGKKRFGAGVVFDYAHNPLVLYDADGNEAAGVVSDQFFAHLGGVLIVEDRARFALSLPIALVQAGEAATAGTTRIAPENAATIGDLRLAADLRLVGQYTEPLTLGVGLQFFVPTGSRDSFTSDGAVRLIPRVTLAGEIEPLVYSLSLGFQYRASGEGFAGDPRGSEALVNAALGVRVLDRRLVVGPELFGSAEVESSDQFFAKHRTPFELMLGGHFALTPDWKLGAGVGPGLTRALGTPAVRGLLSVEWMPAVTVPPPPPTDRDHDGIIDPQDACPDAAGPRTEDPKTNGCPPPPDRDRDGVLDPVDACPDDAGEASDDPALNGCPDSDHDKIVNSVDACPTVPGIKTEDPKTNGCPDRDQDKIIDDADACPDEPGEPNADPKKNGCPPPKDRDGDGILNEQDACPDAAGPADPNPKKNGCPAARVEKGQIRILEQVQFAYNSAQILKASDFILAAVAKILSENPQIKTVRIEGHTDNKGGDVFNKKLSQKRAEAVSVWLTKHGIDKSRLSASGLGKERPIDTNDTDEGRANNRRVEFHIEGQEPEPAP